MSHHPDPDDLLRYAFGLADESAATLAEHLDQCADCRAALATIRQREADTVNSGSQEHATASVGLPLGWIHSTRVPLLICVGTAVLAGILAYVESASSFAIMALGALGVTAWLVLVISRIERSWNGLDPIGHLGLRLGRL